MFNLKKMTAKGKLLATAACANVVALSTALVSFAEGEADGISTVTTAVTSSASGIVSSGLNMLGTIIPYALTFVGAILVFNIGKSFIKKIRG